MSTGESPFIGLIIPEKEWQPLRVKVLHPPWCHRQAIIGTGPASDDRSCKQCPWRSSCGEVG